MADGKKFRFKPKGFWGAERILLIFKMGWKGIIINIFFEDKEESFLLTLKGLFSNKYILLDTDKSVILAAEANFKMG